jgi:hypothetical protein
MNNDNMICSLQCNKKDDTITLWDRAIREPDGGKIGIRESIVRKCRSPRTEARGQELGVPRSDPHGPRRHGVILFFVHLVVLVCEEVSAHIGAHVEDFSAVFYGTGVC